MNRNEHIIACLAEECAEVIKLCMKSERFGCRDGYPGTGRINEKDVQKEFLEAVAVMEMLQDEVFHFKYTKEESIKIIEDKKVKVNEFMNYARSVGTLTE